MTDEVFEKNSASIQTDWLQNVMLLETHEAEITEIENVPPFINSPEIAEALNGRIKLNELPDNHSALYTPLIQPTGMAGMDALAVDALAFLTDGETVVHRLCKSGRKSH